MKVLLWFLTMVLLTQATAAQSGAPDDNRNDGDRTAHRYRIRNMKAEGCNVRIFTWVADKPEEPGFLCNVFVYDTNGNIVQEKRFDANSRQVKVLTFVYNSVGQLICEKAAEENGRLLKKVDYLYDKDGNVVEERVYDANTRLGRYVTHFGYSGGNCVYSDILDSVGTLIKRTETRYSFNNPVEVSELRGDQTLMFTTKFMYDESGNCTEIEETDRIGQKSGIRYLYDKAGHMVEETYYSSNGKSYLKYQYEYSDSGLVVRQKELDSRNRVASSTEYFYNEAGLIEKEIWLDAFNKPQTLITYDYTIRKQTR